MAQKLAFIGMGIMGLPMAGHLLAAGHAVTVHSRTRAKADAILAKGAKWADSPAGAARGAEVTFVCVTDTPDVEAVVLGEGGVISGAAPGTVLVDHSTISPAATRKMATRCSAGGVSFLDAPVSGGDVGAKNATLSIMAGGDAAAFERVRPLLGCMGRNIVHCGGVGTGQLTKLVNQILVSVTNLAVCEALTFAGRCGLDLERTIAAVGGGAAGSWQLANLGPKMVGRDFAPAFMIDLMQKDLRLVMQAAQEAGVALPASGLVHQLFTAAQASGDGRAGTQALYKVIQKMAGE